MLLGDSFIFRLSLWLHRTFFLEFSMILILAPWHKAVVYVLALPRGSKRQSDGMMCIFASFWKAKETLKEAPNECAKGFS